jgi:hypothetical protein
MTDRLTRLTTALAVLMVAGVAAVMSYQQAYELVISHGGARLHRGPVAVHRGWLDLGRVHVLRGPRPVA